MPYSEIVQYKVARCINDIAAVHYCRKATSYRSNKTFLELSKFSFEYVHTYVNNQQFVLDFALNLHQAWTGDRFDIFHIFISPRRGEVPIGLAACHRACKPVSFPHSSACLQKHKSVRLTITLFAYILPASAFANANKLCFCDVTRTYLLCQ